MKNDGAPFPDAMGYCSTKSSESCIQDDSDLTHDVNKRIFEVGLFDFCG